MNYVSSNVGSNMDFHAATYSSHWPDVDQDSYNVYAETKHFAMNGTNINSSTGVPTSSWWYAEIYINNDEFLLDSFTNDQAQVTIYHEMGHAFGLAHNNTNVYSIMCQTGVVVGYVYYARQVQTVQYTDNQAIMNLYGG